MSPRSGKIDWVGESNSYARMMVVCRRDSAAFTPAPDGALPYRVDQIGTTIAVLPATCKGGRHLVVPGVSRAISPRTRSACTARPAQRRPASTRAGG